MLLECPSLPLMDMRPLAEEGGGEGGKGDHTSYWDVALECIEFDGVGGVKIPLL